VCLRVGTLLLAIWLAYPQLHRISPIMLVSSLVGAIVVVCRPRLIVIVVPILVAIWFLRPRSPPSPANAEKE
jgi:hypothetical protein